MSPIVPNVYITVLPRICMKSTTQIQTTDATSVRFDSPMITFLRNQGIDFSIREHQHFELTSEGWMDLIVESWYEGKYLYVSVAHYGRQNGDAMRDPEIVYLVNMALGRVIPSMYQNDYIGSYQESAFVKEDTLYVKRAIVKDLKSFTRTWVQNLKAQGHKLEVKN